MIETDEFENINMINLRDVLCKIFFGSEWESKKKYVVPLQGNWYNPSQVHNLDNWIGYVIDSLSTDVAIVNRGDDGRRYYREAQTTIHLSFIGVDAENLAQSVLFWLVREDVKKLLDDKYKGVINNKEFEIYSSLYEQEGLNSTLCWNVEFSLQHNILLDSESPILRKADISGNIIIGG
jgi:hypothetical protein